MKRFFISAAVAVMMGTCLVIGKFTVPQDNDFSEIQLANIEALTNNEYSGKACWAKGSYDIDYPEALVCDTPCKMKPWNPPLFGSWFGGMSYCE